MATTTGYLLIVDITGYTEFLTESELDHAQDILNSLFDELIAQVRPPLQISNFQGDAILTFAPDEAILSGQTMLDMIDQMYCAFMAHRERMAVNTTCTCDACRNIPGLDLKAFLHHGEFVVQPREGRDELSGKDVILIHRLLKNEVAQQTGITAYALVTEEAVAALDVAPFFADMPRYTQDVDRLGAVTCAVYDLGPVWEAERAARQVVVAPDEADYVVETYVPLPLLTTWEYLLDPATRKDLTHSDSFDVAKLQAGRQGIGTEHHCYHGDTPYIQTIVDWQPPTYITFRSRADLPLLPVRLTLTTYLEESDEGTRIQWVGDTPGSTDPVRGALVRLVWKFFLRSGTVERLEESGEIIMDHARAERQASKTTQDTGEGRGP